MSNSLTVTQHLAFTLGTLLATVCGAFAPGEATAQTTELLPSESGIATPRTEPMDVTEPADTLESPGEGNGAAEELFTPGEEEVQAGEEQVPADEGDLQPQGTPVSEPFSCSLLQARLVSPRKFLKEDPSDGDLIFSHEPPIGSTWIELDDLTSDTALAQRVATRDHLIVVTWDAAAMRSNGYEFVHHETQVNRQSRQPIAGVADSNYVRWDISADVDAANASHGTLLSLNVTFRAVDGKAFAPCSFHVERKNLVSAYGLDFTGSDTLGLWLPTGLFGSNLRRTDSGISFAAVPFGVGIGTRFHAGRKFYFGFSAFVGWSITEGTADGQTAGGDDAAGDRFVLRSVASGAIIDLGGYVSVAPLYVADWAREENIDASGFIFGISVGPNLLTLLTKPNTQ
jgi:hypothetical protein